MPYAYGATIKHVFAGSLLELYLTFRHQMFRSTDYTADPVVYDVFPPLETWIIEADSVAVDAVANEWIDEYTLMLTTDTVSSRPSQVTVEYAGPNVNLSYRWGKQLEPFGPLFSYDQNWYQNPSYVDRGDPADWDFTDTDLTKDNNWYDLDLSGILPSGVSSVLLRVFIRSPLVGEFISFRKNGNSNTFNIDALFTQVGDGWMRSSVVVAVDDNRTIEYNISSANFDFIFISVGGWFQ
jgi:hypothetical protein